jgi:hypothetical protein
MTVTALVVRAGVAAPVNDRITAAVGGVSADGVAASAAGVWTRSGAFLVRGAQAVAAARSPRLGSLVSATPFLRCRWELWASKTDVRAVEARKLALRAGADLEECMCEPRDVVARHRERSFTTRQRARLVQLLSVHPDRHARA